MSKCTALRFQRLDRGFTLAELGRRAGMTVGKVACIEEGLVRATEAELERLARALDVPVGGLVFDPDDVVEVVPLQVASRRRRAAR